MTSTDIDSIVLSGLVCVTTTIDRLRRSLRASMGASRFMTTEDYSRYGIAQRDGTSFVLPRTSADRLVGYAKTDPNLLEKCLGLPTGHLKTRSLIKIDFTNDVLPDLNIRIPSGHEAGANGQWLPGGRLSSGMAEAVIDGHMAQEGVHFTIQRLN